MLKYALGDLDRVGQVVQMVGYVNSAPGFSEPPQVINGATDLLVELYGGRGGRYTRGHWLPGALADNSSVEVVLTVLFKGGTVRPPLGTVSLRSG